MAASPSSSSSNMTAMSGPGSGLYPRLSSLTVSLFIFLMVLMSGCSDTGTGGELLEGQQLFSIPVGKLEDEIDILHRGNRLPNKKNSVFLYQGLIFVGNSLGSKVMEFSSFGDLISLIYNEETNPRPVMLSSNPGEQSVVNRIAKSYPFREIGDIAVTSRHVLLVEDHVSPERRLFEESGTVLQHIVHRFAPDGSYLDYIGQEGVGGTPFPYIISLQVTSRDDLVVFTQDREGYSVYWYDSAGDVRFTIHIDQNHLPAGDDPQQIPQLLSIYPDMEMFRLYLHVNLQHPDDLDVESRIYLLDLPRGIYSSGFELPENIQSVPGADGISELEYPYTFIGTAEDNRLFFLSRNNAFEQSLIIMDHEGRLLARRRIRVENPDIFISDYQVSPGGIISALLGDPENAYIYWWRSDQL